MELDSLRCTYTVGPGAWELNSELTRLGRLVEGQESEELLGIQLDPHEDWKHQKDIALPEGGDQKNTKPQAPFIECTKLHFDGACQSKLGGGGFIVWDEFDSFRVA